MDPVFQMVPLAVRITRDGSTDEVGISQPGLDLEPGEWLRVGRGFVEYQPSAAHAPIRLAATDIGHADLKYAVFDIHHKEAKVSSSAGKISFEYYRMLNAKAFMRAMGRYVGATLSRGAILRSS